MREFEKFDGIWHRRDPGGPWERLVLEDVDIAMSRSAAHRNGMSAERAETIEKAGKRWLWEPVK